MEFPKFVPRQDRFEYALVQTGMTNWYPGLSEVIDDLRAVSAHARTLGADLIVEGLDLDPLWRFLGLTPRRNQLPFWDLYPRLKTGVLKLGDGCPYRCTYCSVPQIYPKFSARPLETSLGEFDFLARSGVEHIVFYDDALLFQADRILEPFLSWVIDRDSGIDFDAPNALNARFITLGLLNSWSLPASSTSTSALKAVPYTWQKKTGGKVYSEELATAVENLLAAGSDPRHLHAYIIVGHPNVKEQQVEESMRFAHSLGIRVMLSEFSPIPGTPDGEACRRQLDLEEPLSHNKTYFTLLSLGDIEGNRLKNLAVALNRDLSLKNLVNSRAYPDKELFFN